MTAVITIKPEPPAERNLIGKGYSFDIILLPHFSPYPQLETRLTKKTLVDKILDGYAILAVQTATSYIDSWTGRQKGDPILNMELFGIEPFDNGDKADKRLYDRIKAELERFRIEGYQFEIKDETKYAPKVAER